MTRTYDETLEALGGLITGRKRQVGTNLTEVFGLMRLYLQVRRAGAAFCDRALTPCRGGVDRHSLPTACPRPPRRAVPSRPVFPRGSAFRKTSLQG